MVRHGDLLLRPIPEPKKVLAAAEVAAFTLATSEATHTLTGRIEPATVEVSEGTAIPAVHVLEPSSLIHEEHPTLTVEPGWYEVASAADESGRLIGKLGLALPRGGEVDQWRARLNLKAFCQRCHMLHDRPEHQRRRWFTLFRRRALGDLYQGRYQ